MRELIRKGWTTPDAEDWVEEFSGRPNLPLREFTMSDVDIIADQLSQEFRDGGAAPNLCHSVNTVFAELAGNAAEHGPPTAYVVAQMYQPRGGIESIQLAVADFGQGVRASLAPRYADAARTDTEALALAFEPGITGTGNPLRGYGLDYVRRELGNALLSLQLRSRGGIITYGRNGGQALRNCNSIPVTVASASLRRTP